MQTNGDGVWMLGCQCMEPEVASFVSYLVPKSTRCAFLQAVDSKLLMRAALYTSTHKHAANNAYNCTNGDTFRWCAAHPGSFRRAVSLVAFARRRMWLSLGCTPTLCMHLTRRLCL
jgi:hypothetical protein